MTGSGLPEVGLHVVARPAGWPGGGGLPYLASIIERAGANGFGRIGTGDVLGNHYELFAGLGALASAARTAAPGVAFGAQVAQPTTRDPSVMAAGMRTLADVCSGGFFWVLGRGDGAARNSGQAPMPVEQFKAYTAALRELLDTGRSRYEGRDLRCPWPASGAAPRVYIAAEGPRMLRMAAGFGDGAYLGTGFTSEAVAHAVDALGMAPGAPHHGRFEAWWVARSAVAATREAAQAAVAEDLSSAGNHALRGDYAAKAVPVELHKALGEYHRRYSYAAKAVSDGPSPNADLMRGLGLERYFLERFGVCGDPAQVASRLRELKALGVERVVLRARSVEEVDLISEALGAPR